MAKEVHILSKGTPKRIQLADGKEYALSPLNLNMMEELEEKFDKPWDELITKLSTKVLKALLYVCLKPNHPELTEQQVGELVTAELLTKSFMTALR